MRTELDVLFGSGSLVLRYGHVDVSDRTPVDLWVRLPLDFTAGTIEVTPDLNRDVTLRATGGEFDQLCWIADDTGAVLILMRWHGMKGGSLTLTV